MRLNDLTVNHLPSIVDQRGALTFIESIRHVPFAIKRIFYVYGIVEGAERGGHAHRSLEQFIIPVAGSFDILLDDGTDKRQFTLNCPSNGLYVPPLIWGQLNNFSANAICLVLASDHYDEQDYFREYEQFIRTVRC